MHDSIVIGLDKLWPDWYARAPLEMLGDPEGEAHRNVRSGFIAMLSMAASSTVMLYEGVLEKERDLVESMTIALRNWAERVGATQLQHRCAGVLEALSKEEEYELHQRLHTLLEDCDYNYDALEALA